MSVIDSLPSQSEMPVLPAAVTVVGGANMDVGAQTDTPLLPGDSTPGQSLPAELLAHTDVLVVNEGELATVSGHTGSIGECLARINVPTVVVTLGHHGSCARQHGAFTLQGAYPITPVDTTGAGDTFCGSLVAALSQGKVLPDALQFASAASAIACTRWGAQSSIPEAAEVTAFIAQHPKTSPEAEQGLRAFCGLN